MNVFGGIIFIIIGIYTIIRIPKVLLYKENDYTKFNETTGTVIGTEDFMGNRWIVEFIDENGEKVLGMDDVITYSTFFPKTFNIPEKGQEERIHYWKPDTNLKYSINNKPIKYYIHFYNEDLYKLKKVKGRNHSILAVAIGIIIILCGILVAAH